MWSVSSDAGWEPGPEILERHQALAEELNRASAALYESILADEASLLAASVETLLDEHAGTIQRPEGIVRVTMTNPGMSDAVILVEHKGSRGWGNSVIPLALVPISEVQQRLTKCVAVGILNLIEGARQQGGVTGSPS